MQKNATPRFKKWRLLWRRVRWGRKGWGKEERKRRGGEERGRALTCSSQFGSHPPRSFCEGSRNTSSAIHFISIPTPAGHLHSVSFTFSFLLSASHRISRTITQWRNFTGRPQAWAQHPKWPVFHTNRRIFPSFFFFLPRNPPTLHPQAHFTSQVPPPPWSNTDLCYVTPTRPRAALRLPRGPLFGSCVPPRRGNKWARRSIATPITCRRWEWVSGHGAAALLCTFYTSRSQSGFKLKKNGKDSQKKL